MDNITKEENVSLADSLLQNVSTHNAIPWLFQHQKLFTTDDADQSLALKNLINKLNYINFDGLVKSQKMAIFENSHLTNSASYKDEFGKIRLLSSRMISPVATG